MLLRSDLNVPLDEGEVADDFRIAASLPTIVALRERGAKVVVCSHLGRPKGVDDALRLDPVAARLSELGDFPVTKVNSVAGPEVEAAEYGETFSDRQGILVRAAPTTISASAS